MEHDRHASSRIAWLIFAAWAIACGLLVLIPARGHAQSFYQTPTTTPATTDMILAKPANGAPLKTYYAGDLANLGFPQGSIYVSNVVANGLGVGSDTNPGTAAKPFLTLDHALAVAPIGGVIVLNGTFNPAGADYLAAQSVTLTGVNGAASATLRPASSSSACVLELNPANGGVVAVTNLTISAAGNSNAADICVDAGAAIQTTTLTGVTLVSGTNVPAISSAANAAFNLDMEGGSISGLGYGGYLVQVKSGVIKFNKVACNLTPQSLPITAVNYDGGQGVCVGIDANGAGATAGSVTATVTGNTSNDILPASASSGTIIFDVTVRGGTTPTVTGNSLSLTGAALDANTECKPLNIAPSQTLPQAVQTLTVSNNTLAMNCYEGGTSGPFIGFESYPETAQILASQSGTTLTMTQNLSGTTLTPIAINAAVTFSNTGGSNSTAPTAEHILSGSGNSWVTDTSQTIANTVAYIAGSPYIVNQTTTALTIATTDQPAGDSGQITPGEEVCGGPNWAGACEKVVAVLSPTTFQMSVSQTLASGLFYVGADHMFTTGSVANNVSHYTGVIKNHTVEGGAFFCGFCNGITFQSNYGDGADYVYNDKGGLNVRAVSNVLMLNGAPADGADEYGSTNFLDEHNTMISPYNSAMVGWRFGQANDWWQTGYQYPTGTFAGNLIYAATSPGPCAIADGQAVTNFPGGTITAETITATHADNSSYTGTGCAGTYGVSGSQSWAAQSPIYIGGAIYSATQNLTTLTVTTVSGPVMIGSRNSCKTKCTGAVGSDAAGITFENNDYFFIGGSPASGYMWEMDIAGSSYTEVDTSTLATWQTTTVPATGLALEPTAAQLDPQLVNFTNLAANISNLNIKPMSSSQIISGASASISGLPDFSGAPFAASPTYGAAQYQGSLLPSPSVSSTTTGLQNTEGSTGTYYYMGISGSMSALDTVGTDIYTTAGIAGYVSKMVISDSFKPGYTNPGVATFVLYDNAIATTAKCTVPQTGNSCVYQQSGPPVNVAATDQLTVKYCMTGDTTGNTCTSYTSATGRLQATVTITP